MKIEWILDRNHFEDLEELKSAIESNGQSYRVMSKEELLYLGSCNDSMRILHGSINFNYMCPDLTNLVKCSMENYRYTHYSRLFNTESLLNEYFIPIQVGHVKSAMPVINDYFGDRFFIKSNSGNKAISGEVVGYDEDLVRKYGCNENEVIIISHKEVIHDEYRVFICNGQIAGSVKYFKGGQVVEKMSDNDCVDCSKIEEHIVKCGLIPRDYNPDMIWTMDIGETYCGPKVIECNSFSCASMYGCNKNSLVEKIGGLL